MVYMTTSGLVGQCRGKGAPAELMLDAALMRDSAVVTLSQDRQLTDTYLLALAVEHGARFVTVDRAVSLASVRGATEEFLVTI